MPRRVLPLTTVADGYTYFSCPRTSYLSIQVFNAGIDIGFGDYLGAGGALGAGVYPPVDEYLALSNANWPRACDEIRFKNHVAGTPAQVQITAQGQADLPGDTPLGVSNEPNFLTINPNGTIGATFSGHIAAAGVDLPEASGQPFDPNRGVGWHDPNDNLTYEYVQGVMLGNGDKYLVLSATGKIGKGIILARAGAGLNKTIITTDGFSDFLQFDSSFAKSLLSQMQGPFSFNWVGGTPAATAVLTLTGATGTVDAIVIPGGNINAPGPIFFDFAVVNAIPAGGGSVTVQANTRGGGNPPAGSSMRFNALLFGS